MTATDRARRAARRQAHLGGAIVAAMLLAAFPLRPLLADRQDTVRLHYVPLEEKAVTP